MSIYYHKYTIINCPIFGFLAGANFGEYYVSAGFWQGKIPLTVTFIPTTIIKYI